MPAFQEGLRSGIASSLSGGSHIYDFQEGVLKSSYDTEAVAGPGLNFISAIASCGSGGGVILFYFFYFSWKKKNAFFHIFREDELYAPLSENFVCSLR